MYNKTYRVCWNYTLAQNCNSWYYDWSIVHVFETSFYFFFPISNTFFLRSTTHISTWKDIFVDLGHHCCCVTNSCSLVTLTTIGISSVNHLEFSLRLILGIYPMSSVTSLLSAYKAGWTEFKSCTNFRGFVGPLCLFVVYLNGLPLDLI